MDNQSVNFSFVSSCQIKVIFIFIVTFNKLIISFHNFYVLLIIILNFAKNVNKILIIKIPITLMKNIEMIFNVFYKLCIILL